MFIEGVFRASHFISMIELDNHIARKAEIMHNIEVFIGFINENVANKINIVYIR